MDLNDLLQREQVALHRADRSANAGCRHVLRKLASGYRRQIASRAFSGSALVGAVR